MKTEELNEDNFAKSQKQSVTIEGWVAVDEFDYGDAFIHTEKPTRKSNTIADSGDYYGSWESAGDAYSISKSLFPDLKWEDEPLSVTIQITEK